MAADLQRALGVNSELVESSGGVFEIERNNELVYSKKATGRFPEQDEVLNIIKAIESGASVQQAQKQAAVK